MWCSFDEIPIFNKSGKAVSAVLLICLCTNRALFAVVNQIAYLFFPDSNSENVLKDYSDMIFDVFGTVNFA